MTNGGKAFAKGGIGCLVVFVVLAVLAVALGGHAHLDLVGVVMLLLLGGVLGLIVHWIYQKGRRDADGEDK